MKPVQGKFRLDIRKRFFTETVVTHCNRLPGEAVTATSLPVFKGHLNNLATCFRLGSPAGTGELDSKIFMSSFQIEIFYVSVFYFLVILIVGYNHNI